MGCERGNRAAKNVGRWRHVGKREADCLGRKQIGSGDHVGGESVVREAEIFVSVLGASNLTYVEAIWSQGLPDGL
jgi:transposase